MIQNEKTAKENSETDFKMEDTEKIVSAQQKELYLET
jgi:hypothetical protein